ncbi:CYTH domain-containing protein [Marinobacter salinexigens]|uniref:CYTH domain-containing protein n=1 Tax=Marinobacter salinexigens TaxID=2919747 RepID=A0A5B0VBP0_9GAMM|nr:CYTH domain-containing protein [Marinobacter salinexigens]KAA1171615.1 CYTH domain-containing protein [Marinobacter salinexigens]
MSEELEIKLTLSGDALPQALDWLLAQPEAIKGNEKLLVNRYFDTPGSDLNRQRAALRVRQAGGRFIQTLKTRGEFVDGAHKRQEWEWPLQGAGLDMSLLAATSLGDAVDLSSLYPVFETNFRRQVVDLQLGATEVEVAVDHGEVISGNAVKPLSEVEFELKAGDPGALVQWAMKLAEQVPVFLNLVSKAEQGYYLAGLHTPQAWPEGNGSPLSVTDFLYGLSVLWLTGEVVSFDQLDLSDVANRAKEAGASDLFARVVDAAAAGVGLDALINEGVLGRLQLSIAAA